MIATEQIFKTEKRSLAIRIKRCKAEEIILMALRCAIEEGLNEVLWVGSREDCATSVLDIWLNDEDGSIAVDRLVNLIIY
jgi:hypothetical protein